MYFLLLKLKKKKFSFTEAVVVTEFFEMDEI